jgi:hypothetical protein
MKVFVRMALLVMIGIIAQPLVGWAQEAVVTGTISDSTGGVLPGVLVKAVNEATGNSFEAVSDTAGNYRLAIRVGSYRVTAELQGFTTVTRTGLELLIGQQAVVNLQLTTSAIQESVTVMGDSPLIDVTRATLGKSIDPRQMQDLPVNGRNWVDLTMLAPGSRLNASTDEPGAGIGTFQLNVDGLRVTQNQTTGFGQPHYSRDAIAEFEFVSGQFDATQGGSMGVQVNAVTKSGTNTPGGSISGYFRNDKFNAADPVAGRVLPYSDQQISTTYGGPLRKDRLHFFAHYEYERQPLTIAFSSPYPAFNFDQTGTVTEKKGGVRLDYQVSPQTHLALRGNGFESWQPYDPRYSGGASRHPSSSIQTTRHSNDYLATLTQVISGRTLNEVRVGYAGFYWIQDSVVPWPNHPTAGLTMGTPILTLRGYTIGQAHQNSHEYEDVENYTVRDNLNLSFSKWGHQTVRIGGEYLYQQNPVFLCNKCMGLYDMTGGAVPANVDQLFPVWNDVSTWNLNALSSITRSYTLGVGQMKAYAPLQVASAWIQDDWQITNRLTLNLGLRYDIEKGAYAEEVAIQPFLSGNRPIDTNNFGPRLGFAYRVTDRTVLRGGTGLYYADPGSQVAYWTKLWSQELHPQVLNDGRADFASNPFNGPIPTYDQVAQTLCTVSNKPGCLRRTILGTLAAPENEVPYSYQTSVGVQRQLAGDMMVESDVVFIGNRKMLNTLNRNLAYNPATGANYAYTDLAHLPYPQWGEVDQRVSNGQSNYYALQLSFTKRMTKHWQASATYLYSRQYNLQVAPILPGCAYPTTVDASGTPGCSTPVTLTPDLAQEFFLSPDQRKRATFNSIVELPFGMQASGTYLYGDNGWATPTSGVDVRSTGATGGTRLLADGSLVARNSFDIPPIHRVDLRLQRRFSLGPKLKIDGMIEVFNALNHTNLVTYVTNLSNKNYGRASGDTNIDYQPRMLQFGFRVAF